MDSENKNLQTDLEPDKISQEEQEIKVDDSEIDPDLVEELPTYKQFVGRPTKYTEDMPEKLFNHFIRPRMRIKYRKATYHGKEIKKAYYEPERLPTREGFCVEQCIGPSTFLRWINAHEEFRTTYEFCKSRQKDVLVQNLLEGEWNFRVGTLIAVNYTDIREALPAEIEEMEEEFGIEAVPKRQKGYDISQIDSFCKDNAIETTATHLGGDNGKKEAVHEPQEAKDIQQDQG